MESVCAYAAQWPMFVFVTVSAAVSAICICFCVACDLCCAACDGAIRSSGKTVAVGQEARVKHMV